MAAVIGVGVFQGFEERGREVFEDEIIEGDVGQEKDSTGFEDAVNFSERHGRLGKVVEGLRAGGDVKSFVGKWDTTRTAFAV